MFSLPTFLCRELERDTAWKFNLQDVGNFEDLAQFAFPHFEVPNTKSASYFKSLSLQIERFFATGISK